VSVTPLLVAMLTCCSLCCSIFVYQGSYGHVVLSNTVHRECLMWVIGSGISILCRSLGQVSLLFGQAVRGITAGSRIFEVDFFVQ